MIGRGSVTKSWWFEHEATGQFVCLEPSAVSDYERFQTQTGVDLIKAKDEDVPDHIWVALAEWRLTHG
jgi:hypothetical protein